MKITCPQPPAFADIQSAAEKEFASHGAFFLQEAYIDSVQQKTNGFPAILSAVQAEAARVRADDAAARYALFLYRAVCTGERFYAQKDLFPLPEEYPLFGSLCLIPFIGESHAEWSRRGLPEEILLPSVRAYEACVLIQRQRIGVLGLGKIYFDFCRNYVECRELRIGRLQFEYRRLQAPVCLLRNRRTGEDTPVLTDGAYSAEGLCASAPPVRPAVEAVWEETAEAYIALPVTARGRAGAAPVRFSKAEYAPVLRRGDPVWNVHISPGGPLTAEVCAESFRQAVEVQKKYYPERPVKGFLCSSWMLAPELEDFLRPESNIVAFGRRFARFPIPSEGRDVFTFVFTRPFRSYDELPETSALERGLKALYQRGDRLYEYGGVFTADRI